MASAKDLPFDGGVEVGLYGLARAIERFGPARSAMLSGEGAKAVAIVVGEALWWVAALDDFFRTDLGRNHWFGIRHADPHGQCVAGLLYARNLHSHQLSPLGCLTDDLRPVAPEPPPTPPANLGPNDQWVAVPPIRLLVAWRRLSDLPRPGKPEMHGRDRMYDQTVATRPLAEPLQDALSFFKAKRSLLSCDS